MRPAFIVLLRRVGFIGSFVVSTRWGAVESVTEEDFSQPPLPVALARLSLTAAQQHYSDYWTRGPS